MDPPSLPAGQVPLQQAIDLGFPIKPSKLYRSSCHPHNAAWPATAPASELQFYDSVVTAQLQFALCRVQLAPEAAMDAIAACPLYVSTSIQWRHASSSHQRSLKGRATRWHSTCCSSSSSSSNGASARSEQPVPENGEPWQRREVIGQALLAMSSGIALPALATTGTDAASEFAVFEDATDKFSLMVPQDWSKGEGVTSGQRKVTAFYPSDGGLTNVNVVITGLGADFTGLGSFGTADNFAENLVNSLDRSWQKPPGQKARLVSSRSKGDKYYVEYTLQRPGEKQRHLVSVVGIASNGWVNRLYTVTGQYFEDDAEKYKTDVEKVISSFNLL